jgi:hypothetical protein
MKKQEPKKLERVTLTLQEWWQATRQQVQRNRKKYTRKKKHRNG